MIPYALIINQMTKTGKTLSIKLQVIADNLTRAITASGLVGGERLHLPSFAPWRACFVSELLGFPSAKYDDQVDALTQLIAMCPGAG